MDKVAKRLIITGFGCPPQAWEKLFPNDSTQRIISFAEVLQNCPENDLRKLANSLVQTIIDYQPDVIVLHDFGVLLGLLALFKARKRAPEITPKLIIFNGGFHYFNVFKAPHPFKIQCASFAKVAKHIKAIGGELDPALALHFKRIKKLYRQVIMASILGLIKSKSARQFDLGNKVLIVASSNDPYIPPTCLQRITEDFLNTELREIDYGHFPYAGNIEEIRKVADDFIAHKEGE